MSDLIKEHKLIGKVVYFEDGTEIMLMSGGLGTGHTYTFRKDVSTGRFVQMDMREALPYIVGIAKHVLSDVER